MAPGREPGNQITIMTTKTSTTKLSSRPTPEAKGNVRRVFLVDDHPLIRKGINDLISEQPDLQVCGEAGSAPQAVAAIARLKPDLVIVDISLPGRDGIELIKDLRSRHRAMPILALSMHDEALYAERVLHAGARGYVMKSAPSQELIAAIRLVLAGEIAVGRRVIHQILARTAGGKETAPCSPVECLTDRELEVFRLLGRGLQRAEISEQLKLSVKTIDTHRENIRQKLGVPHASDVRQLAAEFLRAEVVDTSSR
jgi:DNA-binding NarL/FixJ family response regulator